MIPHKQLVWTNQEAEGDAVTTVTFEEAHGRTLLVVRELYPSKDALDEAIASGASAAVASSSRHWTGFCPPWANSYGVRNVTLNFIHAAFDPKAVRAILPRTGPRRCSGRYNRSISPGHSRSTTKRPAALVAKSGRNVFLTAEAEALFALEAANLSR